MTLIFYPHSEDIGKGMLDERVEMLMDASERYKAVILDVASKQQDALVKKIGLPRDLTAAFHWDELAAVLRKIRELPEGNKEERVRKAVLLTKLSEIYEILRAAKMPKLEAVRLALISEAKHLGGGTKVGGDTSHVA